jgi:VWFA-related protein
MNTKFPGRVVLVLALVACSPPAQGQSPDGASTNAFQKAVVLNITAVDGRGDAVTDLTSADFQIIDDGNPQVISSFQAGTPPSAAQNPTPATVILFDLLNSNARNREYDCTFIVRALEPLETADTVYLYLLTNGGEFYPVHAFPPRQDIAFLARNKGTGAGASAWTRQIRPLLDDAIQKVYGFRTVDYRDPGYRAATTFVALSKLQDAFMEIPGPKSIVWITSGVTNWPDYPHGCKDMTITDASGSYVGGKCTANCRRLSKCVDYEPFFQHFSSVLNHTNTVVDAAEDLPQGALPPNNRGTAVDTLQRMADLSGGRLYPGTNIDKAILEAMKKGRGRYQVSIAAPAADGKYHKVRVTCARKGVRVEGPKGYFADQS